MKVKMKFNAAALKKGALEHGEKVAFGLVAIIFLLLTWSAVSVEVLDSAKQPDRLQSKAGEVTTHVSAAPWDAKQQNVQVVDYLVRTERKPLSIGDYKMAPINEPLAERKAKRDKPELFRPEELRVASGYGAFSLKTAAAQPGQPAAQNAGGKNKGQAWAVITGIVPIEKQREEYARVFDRAVQADKLRDVPKYLRAKLERAEVNSTNPDQLEWKPVAASTQFEQQWSAPGKEPVAAEYVDDKDRKGVTAPLGPRVDAGWDVSVCHPKIPLVQDNRNQPQQAPVAAPAGENVSPSGDEAEAAGDRPPVAPPIAKPADPATKQGVPYYLLRAFDYTVEPNKRYRYRVTLRLENPNFNIPEKYLKDPTPPPEQVIFAPPSEPTGIVTIPDGYRAFAGAVTQKAGDLAAKLMVSLITKDQGIDASTELDVQRGSVANAFVKDPITLGPEKLSNVDFKSAMVVLDLHGGKALPSRKVKYNVPGEILLMDQHGNLFVRNELDDTPEYEHRKPPEGPDKKATPLDDPPKKSLKSRKAK